MFEIGVSNITPLKMIGPLYLNYFLFNNQNKNHTLMQLKIYTALQYRMLQYKLSTKSTCQGIIKKEIILLNII